MIAYFVCFASWLLGVCFSVAVDAFDGRFGSRGAREDALREALIWPLVRLPWRDWQRPGRHRLRRAAS